MIRISKHKPSKLDYEDNSIQNAEKEKIKEKLIFDVLFNDYK